MIIPVSLGSYLQDDEYRGTFKPINLHLPIYMGIWFALKNYMQKHDEAIKLAKKDVSDYEDLIREEESSFFLFRSDDNIKLWRQAKAGRESKIRELENEVREMRKSYDRLERELYSINLTFINGRWRK